MPTLREILEESDTRPKVIRDCEALVDEEVGRKRGFTGAAVRGAFKVVKTVSPSIVREVVTKLLPEFADALQPIFEESEKAVGDSGSDLADDFAGRLRKDPGRAADALLSVTDRKIDRARRPIKRAYGGLRSGARDHVMQAIPGMATKLSKHL